MVEGGVQMSVCGQNEFFVFFNYREINASQYYKVRGVRGNEKGVLWFL